MFAKSCSISSFETVPGTFRKKVKEELTSTSASSHSHYYMWENAVSFLRRKVGYRITMTLLYGYAHRI